MARLSGINLFYQEKLNDKIIYLPSNDIPKDKQNWNYSVKIKNNNVE